MVQERGVSYETGRKILHVYRIAKAGAYRFLQVAWDKDN